MEDICSELSLLNLFFNSDITYEVVFTPHKERVPLLCSILTFIDNDLESYFHSLTDQNKLVKGDIVYQRYLT